ncbi:MAG: sigma 54-dependent Fis family transcriptional regulator [Myxococcales bacterium]|nr:sigma 54-dependent Fis family transcriptional regulator [Myxococcales bacterium]
MATPDQPSFDSPATEGLGEEPEDRLPLKLVVISGPAAGSQLLLEPGTHRIGKAAENDLVVKDPAVSRFHVEVEVLGARARFTDLASTNGSFCEDIRFQRVEVSPGAVIRIGKGEIKLALSTERAQLFPSQLEAFGQLSGRSLAMRKVFAVLERVSRADASLLIEGETGTGKELCAQAVHQAGRRASGPFVIVDLAGIQPNLIESELFGHVRGAFTGALGDRAGAFERAHLGTIFLDEIGELAPELQPRLLRALENGQVKRLGANDYRSFDARVIAATHRDLAADVKAGRFRQDLYHRLSVVRVRLPALRERREDLPLLVNQLLDAMGHPGRLGPATMGLLRSHPWPGNVRELRNVVERALALGGGDDGIPDELFELLEPKSSAGGAGFKEAKEQVIAAFERDYLADLLERCKHNIALMAREARLDRVSVYRLLKKHGVS